MTINILKQNFATESMNAENSNRKIQGTQKAGIEFRGKKKMKI